MSAATMTTTDDQLALVFQYTLEAYKTFQKLAELVPNPMSRATFASLAADERNHRDLLEMKYTSGGPSRIQLTLGSDLRFQDMLEGDLSDRNIPELLIARERTMERRLREFAQGAKESERNLLNFIAATKRAHMAYLERELEMIKAHPDWLKREDAEDLVVHGSR